MRETIILLLFSLISLTGNLDAEEAQLLRSPAMSKSHIAFVYANDIWISGPDGGNARRLTSFQGAETSPHFSPDGKLVAFAGEYDGNTDVYVVPVEGGEPQRLTWHPGYDVVRGWTRDGKRIVFASGRDNVPVGFPKFWTVDLNGHFPAPMPIPRVAEGKFSPDGKKFVYQKISPWESEWRNYRGGQNNPVRIIDLKSLKVEKLPWDGANDKNPVWVGDKIYFLSDRDFLMNLCSYDTFPTVRFRPTQSALCSKPVVISLPFRLKKATCVI